MLELKKTSINILLFIIGSKTITTILKILRLHKTINCFTIPPCSVSKTKYSRPDWVTVQDGGRLVGRTVSPAVMSTNILSVLKYFSLFPVITGPDCVSVRPSLYYRHPDWPVNCQIITSRLVKCFFLFPPLLYWKIIQLQTSLGYIFLIL